MIYEINKNVLLVFGSKKSIIYDLRDKYVKLIWNNQSNTKNLLNYIKNQKDNEFINELKRLNFLNEKLIKKKNITNPNILDTNMFHSVLIEVTNKCNFSCIHCYGSFKPNNSTEMSIEDIKIIIKNLYKFNNLKNIRIIGGEPFVIKKEKLIQILKLIREHFPKIGLEIYTNGYYINKSWINILKKLNIKLALSIYSDNPIIHDEVTNHKNSFNKLIKNLSLLENNNIKYRISYIKMNINKSLNIDKLRNLYNLRIRHFKSDIIRISGRSERKFLDEELLKEKSITLKVFKNLKLESKKVLHRMYYHNCFSNKIYISSNLDILPCPMEKRKIYGNLRKSPLLSILTDNFDIITLTKDKIETCQNCEFRYACFDCRPDSIGNFYSKPYYCKYNPEKGKWND